MAIFINFILGFCFGTYVRLLLITLLLKFTRWHKTSFFSCVTVEIGKEVRVENQFTTPRWLQRLPVYET